jgi:Zn-dependent protease with chaperone function
MRLLRLTAVAPKVVASTLLTVMFMALLPPLVGLAGFLTSVVVLALLASGLLEEPTLRAFRGARRPGESERVVMAPVLAQLAAAGISVPDFYIDHSPRSAQPAAVLGRRSLIVSRGLVDATYRRQLSRHEAAALIAHAVGQHRARPHRYELALQVWTAPCLGVLVVADRVGAAAAWFPLVRPAWQLRFVIAIICVVQSAADGRTVYGLIAGVFIALTYLVPAADRAIERRVVYAADTYLLQQDLGAVLAGLLRRGGWPVPLERLHRLSHSPSPPLPRLVVMRSAK